MFKNLDCSNLRSIVCHIHLFTNFNVKGYEHRNFKMKLPDNKTLLLFNALVYANIFMYLLSQVDMHLELMYYNREIEQPMQTDKVRFYTK